MDAGLLTTNTQRQLVSVH